MNKAKLLILASMATAFLACDREPVPGPGGQIELRLSGAINIATRGDYTPTQSTVLAPGEAVYAWVDDAGDATATPPIPASEHVKAWSLVCGADGTLTGANKYYFPASGRTVNVYAVHGDFTAPTEGATSWDDFATLTHDIAADQSVAGAYEKSDLLFARNTSILRNNDVKILNFKHMLSKIEIFLVAGNGLVESDITGATVRLLGVQPTATVTLNKSGDPDATVSVSGTPVDIPCRMSYQTDVMVSATAYAYAFGEAIIVPQDFPSPVQLIEVTLPNSGIVLRTAAGTYTFEKGKRYGYNVTVNATDLLLESTITDWTDQGTHDISAD
ncbi:MAG: fimbrillin family protein [Bacteroidales bacterium]|nr:fimbrillin family protein [Bacteroidales bacterium]